MHGKQWTISRFKNFIDKAGVNECICISALEFVSNFSNCVASNGVGWGGVDYKLCMATALKCSALAGRDLG